MTITKGIIKVFFKINLKSKIMTISVTLCPSQSSDHKMIKLEDLGLTEQEWNELDKDTQEEKINEYLADLPEQPYWMVDRFRKKKKKNEKFRTKRRLFK
jgi:hypothetical protein